MKFKYVLVGRGLFWKIEYTLRLGRYSVKRAIWETFKRNVPGIEKMGSAQVYRQHADWGVHLDPDREKERGICICVSQAYAKLERDWQTVAKEVFETVRGVVKVPMDIFLECHVSTPKGESVFIEEPE